MKLTPKQLETVAKIFINIGTLSFGGLVIGKFISPDRIPWDVFISGLIFSIVLFIFAIIIDKGDKNA